MNQKPPEIIERFIELRAADVTFARIAVELNVCKRTLVTWSRQWQVQVQNLRAMGNEAQAEKCKISRGACLENLGEDLRRVREALGQRDLSDVATGRLFALAAQLRAEAGRINGPLPLAEAIAEDAPEEDQFSEATVAWED